MNGHVGSVRNGFEECHGGFGYGALDDEGEDVLNFAKAYGLTLINTMFSKKERHLITYSSGGNNTQIDFLLCSNDLRRMLRDCKVILGESVTSQHRLVVAKLQIKRNKKHDKPIPTEKIKWFNLNSERGEQFVSEQESWLLDVMNAAEDLNAE